MSDLITKALKAKRESKTIDFKSRVDFTEPQTWCELLKDIVAMANSGGGVILVGVDDNGKPTGDDVTSVLEVDPATVADKIYRYTGVHFEDFGISEKVKGRRRIAAIEISAVDTPIVFTKPGTYALDEKRQKTAFSLGTVYFRHGAKSEPGTSADLNQAIERRLRSVKKSWLSNVRKVVQAPQGTRIVTLNSNQEVIESTSPHAVPIRVTDDISAPAYRRLDYDSTHPYRQKELIAEVNRRLNDNYSINQHDIQSVKLVHNLYNDERFCHCPKYSSPQYTEVFVEWLVDRYSKDATFFNTARERSYEMRHKIQTGEM